MVQNGTVQQSLHELCLFMLMCLIAADHLESQAWVSTHLHGLDATVESQAEARECGNSQDAALTPPTAALSLKAQCLLVSWSS